MKNFSKKSPKVSVVIPAYNVADYLSQAIQSVIDQTYCDWELVVVDDGSTDTTASVAKQFDDPRIRYVYQTNKGLPGARNTGIVNSSGEYLVFLDADDLYHVDKLALQVSHLDQNPEVGLSYSSRFEIDQAGNILALIRPPGEVTIKTLIMKFPFTVNDLMVRRSWVETVNSFDESFVLNSEDRDFYLRLALAGCHFARLDRALAYRRFHGGRTFRNLVEKTNTVLRALETAFSDPRCPEEVRMLRDIVRGKAYLYSAYVALAQDETAVGQEFVKKAIRLNPTLLDNTAKPILSFFISASIGDGDEHEELLRKVFAQLPPELEFLTEYCDWAVAQGYLMRGVGDAIWNRLEQNHNSFVRASELGAQLDQQFSLNLIDQLLNYETEFGSAAAQDIFRNIITDLAKIGKRSDMRWLKGCWWTNQAFKSYYDGKYKSVPTKVFRAVGNNPKYLVDRGAMAILLRSIVNNVWKS